MKLLDDSIKIARLDGPTIKGRAPTLSECKRLSARLKKYITRHKLKTLAPPPIPKYVDGYRFGHVRVMWQYRVRFDDIAVMADAVVTE